MRKMNWIKKHNTLFVLLGLLFVPFAFTQEQEPQMDLSDTVKKDSFAGKLEIGIHYGPWTLKPISNYFEDELLVEISKEVRKRVNDELSRLYPGVGDYVTGYEDALVFGSSGSNFGVEIRFYPKGKEGSFSLGFSVEKTKIKVKAEGPITQYYEYGVTSTVDGLGYITTNPLTMNLSFRWDINPAWRISPYFVCGFGLATLVGEVNYEWVGTYNWRNLSGQLSGSDTLTFQDVEWEFDENIPNIFYLIQLNLGVRARITPNVYLNAEAGFWDGMLFRAGVFYRF
jgi:hypothetical protein